jgi:hypothetical protein
MQIVFKRGLYDETIYGAAERDAFSPAVKIYSGCGGKGLLGVLERVESLCIEICLYLSEILVRPDALQYFLIDKGINAEGNIIVENLLKCRGSLCVIASEKIDKNRGVDKDHSFPSAKRFVIVITAEMHLAPQIAQVPPLAYRDQLLERLVHQVLFRLCLGKLPRLPDKFLIQHDVRSHVYTSAYT